jgi:acetyl esterase/lipase
VSIDYRLAPETRLPEIVEDLEDSLAWVRTRGAELFGADPGAIAVVGESAGGYLALVSGYRASPRPTALVSLYGPAELTAAWAVRPSEQPRHNRRTISPEEARAQVNGPPVSDARDREGQGALFYHYTRQSGTWPEAVSGWDPHVESERYLPYTPLANVSADFPPTLLVHGTRDTEVPYEQSQKMAEQLAKHGVVHELLTVPDVEHGLVNGDPRLATEAYAAVVSWLTRWLPPPEDPH